LRSTVDLKVFSAALLAGAHTRAVDPRELLHELERPALGHAGLVGRFIVASELVQGLADASFPSCDGRTAVTDAAMRVCVSIARQIEQSWRGVAVESYSLDELAAQPLPDAILCKRVGGYAFDALYPEMYLDAARCAPVADRRVIGIRSIGAGLAALVAVATGAPLPTTVRPRGELYREISVARELAAEWTTGAVIAIVGEGPGMSGSSFGCIGDLLEDHGVSMIEVFPSHGGDLGPLAQDRHRDRWRRIPRRHTDFDISIRPRLVRCIAELVGRVIGVEDLSGGAWRALRYPYESDWPVSITYQERRKLLVHTGRGSYLARFVGLGRDGDRAFHRARTLHAGGFTPEPVALVHGFLLERWQDLVRPLSTMDRSLLVQRVGEYLAFRANSLRGGTGAEVAQLRALAKQALDLDVPAPTSSAKRVAIDGRLHAHEWLVTPRGLIKADAYDHCASDDLVGCQDIAWDVAGATAELALTPSEIAQISAMCDVDREQLAFARPCYLAFQLARHAVAIEASPPAEQARLRAEVTRYRTLAARLRA
jgi:hypothetical protein